MNLGKLLEDEGQIGVQVVEGVGLVIKKFHLKAYSKDKLKPTK